MSVGVQDYALSFLPISQYLPQNVMQPTVLGPLAKGIKILTGKTNVYENLIWTKRISDYTIY